MHNQWTDQDARRVGEISRAEFGADQGAAGSRVVDPGRLHDAEGLACPFPTWSTRLLEPLGKFGAILADPPWRFQNSTGKVAPGHRRLRRYDTMPLAEIAALPVASIVADPAHLYLWCPNAMLAEALHVMKTWGFEYKTCIVWHKIRKDGGPDGRGVGFYFRNVTEMVLFGVRGRNARTLAPGRRQVNFMATQKREHSRKPDELYGIIEACSPGPWVELFARGQRDGWVSWGEEADG